MTRRLNTCKNLLNCTNSAWEQAPVSLKVCPFFFSFMKLLAFSVKSFVS